MPVEPRDLGAAVCRVIARDMDSKPIVIALPRHGSWDHEYEPTTEARKTLFRQWCAVLTVHPDRVTVQANPQYHGPAVWDYAELSPDAGQFSRFIFVHYPDDLAEITGQAYEARLREAVEKALAAIDHDLAVRDRGTNGENHEA